MYLNNVMLPNNCLYNGKELQTDFDIKKFYKRLNKVAMNKNTVSIEIVENDPDVEIDSFYNEKIDIADAKKLGSSKLEKPVYISSQGASIHEIHEQFQKQVQGKDVLSAHKPALSIENKINGSVRNGVGIFKITNIKR